MTTTEEPADDGPQQPEQDWAPPPAPDYEPCGHPLERGTCWFAQIADPCGTLCKWAMDTEPAGR